MQPRSHNHHHRSAPKPLLNTSTDDPSSWLGFSLPPRVVPGSGGLSGPPPRRSKRGDGWRGGVMSREKFVNASFKFVLKPTEVLSYGAHFADPDISLHWPNILQVLVPTFSALSVAQGYVSSGTLYGSGDANEVATGEEAAERRRRIEEEKRGRMCPICLGKPVAGRMTKCGHIFCFPCILHYIQLSDVPRSAKCPICGDLIQTGMLKSVKYLDAEAMLDARDGEEGAGSSASDLGRHDSGQSESSDEMEEARALDDRTQHHPDTKNLHSIHMRLVQRPPMTTLALPPSSTFPSDALPPHTAPWHFLPDVLTYSRYMLASPAYMKTELEREMTELRNEEQVLRGDELGRVFVKDAMEKVQRQIEKVFLELETDVVERSEKKGREAWGMAVGGDRSEAEKRKEKQRKERDRIDREKNEQAKRPQEDIHTEVLMATAQPFTPRANIDIPPNLPVEPNPMPTTSKKSRKRNTLPTVPPPAVPEAPSYYFYQSSLGANVFLHPLDIRILSAHFGSYNLFPKKMEFAIIGYEPGTVNEDLRKRCKYLSYLPLGAEIVFVETDLFSLVSPDILAQFDQPLRARRLKRKEKVKKEDKAKAKWEKAERERVVGELGSGGRVVPSAFVPGGVDEDPEFALALARSAVDFDQAFPSASPQPSGAGLASSPPRSWGHSQTQIQNQAQAQRSFATALHQRHAPQRMDLARDTEVNAAWEAFESLGVSPAPVSGLGVSPDESTDGHGVRESERGGGTGGKKKKGKGQKLVLGGGGGRRA